MAGYEEPNFHPLFVGAFNALNAHCGGGASVGSGYRTTEEQRALLYKRAQGISVADPGTSRHEGHHGGALDLQFADEQTKACMHANANAFGLGFDVPGEDWHLQLSAEGEAALEAGTFAEQFGIAGTEAEEAEPPADSLDGIRAIIYGGAENPVDVPQRVAEGLAEDEATDRPAASSPAEVALTTGAGSDGDPLSDAEAARYFAQAGFSGDALVTMVAVAIGESGLDPDEPGDEHLADGKWGNSIGLSQIRSLNEQHGTGGWRDATRLTDPAFNAKAAWSISNGGTNFTPWTIYKNGSWEGNVGRAKAAVAALGAGAVGVKTKTPVASTAPPDDDLGVIDDDLGLLDPAGVAKEIAAEMLAERAGSPIEEAGLDEDETEDEPVKRKGGLRSLIGGF